MVDDTFIATKQVYGYDAAINLDQNKGGDG